MKEEVDVGSLYEKAGPVKSNWQMHILCHTLLDSLKSSKNKTKKTFFANAFLMEKVVLVRIEALFQSCVQCFK